MYNLYYKWMHGRNASFKHGSASVNKAILKCFVIGLSVSHMQWSEYVLYHISSLPAFQHLLRLQRYRHELIKTAWTQRQAMGGLEEGYQKAASCAPWNGIMHTEHLPRLKVEYWIKMIFKFSHLNPQYAKKFADTPNHVLLCAWNVFHDLI